MMPHPTLDRLRAFAEPGSPPAPRGRTASHLAECSRCRDTLAWIRAVRAAAAEPAPAAAPAGAWARIAARVEAGETVLLPAAGPDAGSARRRALRPAMLRAAGLVLAVAAAASAAVPGSPLRAWVARLWPSRPTLPSAVPPARVHPAAAPPAAPAPTILFVRPLDGAVSISVVAPDPTLRLRIRVSDGAEVEVRATGAAAGARFRSGPGRLAVSDAGPGELSITLPRRARAVTVEVDGGAYLLKQGSRIRVLAPAADTAGTELVLPVHPADRSRER
ncbi:MAG TPA: hypothetical protein VFQ38_13780 [Longimicrobiales bacterium]|nr:hypothetical protein [Longimicrobiales bacterium]